LREVKPGEIVAINKQGVRTVGQLPATPKAHCVFEFVYFSRPPPPTTRTFISGSLRSRSYQEESDIYL